MHAHRMHGLPVARSHRRIDTIQSVNPVENRRPRAYSDQAVHIGRPVIQRFETAYKIPTVDKKHRDGEQKLRESKVGVIFCARKPGG